MTLIGNRKLVIPGIELRKCFGILVGGGGRELAKIAMIAEIENRRNRRIAVIGKKQRPTTEAAHSTPLAFSHSAGLFARIPTDTFSFFVPLRRTCPKLPRLDSLSYQALSGPRRPQNGDIGNSFKVFKG